MDCKAAGEIFSLWTMMMPVLCTLALMPFFSSEGPWWYDRTELLNSKQQIREAAQPTAANMRLVLNVKLIIPNPQLFALLCKNWQSSSKRVASIGGLMHLQNLTFSVLIDLMKEWLCCSHTSNLMLAQDPHPHFRSPEEVANITPTHLFQSVLLWIYFSFGAHLLAKTKCARIWVMR